MSLLAWIALGLISGFVASKVVNKRGDGLVLDVVLGIVGAVVGGWIFRMLNFYSFAVAVIGAVLVLVLYHAMRGTA